MKTITIIDTFGFFFRSYFALPPLRNSEGFPTGLLTGFIKLVDSLHTYHSTDYLVFALDSKGKTFRNDLFKDYKANRSTPPEDLTKQLPIAIKWIEKMGFANIAMTGYEADDIIASLTTKALENGLNVNIVSHDKDLYQLIEDGKVTIFDSVKKRYINEALCYEKFEVYPKDFTNFQSILGDSSDNIPGVKGIGQKGASKLINEFSTLENIYKNITICGTPRIKKLLMESREMAFLSRELVTLQTDIIDDFDLDKFVFEDKNYLSCLADEFVDYEMKQALSSALRGHNKNKQQSEVKKEEKLSFQYAKIDNIQELNRVIDNISKNSIIAFDTETTGLDTKKVDLVGFSFSISEIGGYYVPIAHSYLGVENQVLLEDALESIKKLMKFKIVGQNLKFDFSLLYNRYGFEKIDIFADTMIMAWLLDSSSKIGLDSLAKKYFKYDMKPFKEIVKKGEDFSFVDIDTASFYAVEDAWMSRKLYFKLLSELELNSKFYIDIASKIEYPFINVLGKMERLGIKIDIQKLQNLELRLENSLQSLTQEIYSKAGSEFNIRSTQQLGTILFEHLGLKGGKKTKTGFSTNEAVLQSIKDKHPIIKLILEYREYQKIISTYVKPLLKLAKDDKNSRVYTSFIQTGTATGRLSSKNPNLQNIPVRSALGREVREAFVAKDGYKLVGIDYSQIELRLLAHFSQDKALMEAFRDGLDIHMQTAIKLFGEDEAKAKRSFAKSINFGLLYGMGSKKLSEELNITTTQAKEIMKNYFEAFPTIKEFLDGVANDVKEIGFVETISKRRRIFDYENANGMQKASFQRESVNTLFQGSASDLIKLSMNKIDTIIENEKLDANMLLQIHDELIFEIKDDKVDELSKKFANMMENIIELEVPLECSVSIGRSWGDLK
jgi:DNA polymerase-1